MRRIPEPELMDDPDQASAYASADFSEPHEAFVSHFRERFPGFAAGEVADLGCGTADVTIRFARAYPQARIVGFDGARAMLDLARQAVAAAYLQDRIRLILTRLPEPQLPLAAFDALISNSLLHHLDDPGVLWQTVKQLAKSNAFVMVMDLLRPGSEEEARALVEAYASEAPEILRRDFFNSLCAGYRPDEIRAQLERSGLAHFSVEVVSDRHVLVWGRL